MPRPYFPLTLTLAAFLCQAQAPAPLPGWPAAPAIPKLDVKLGNTLLAQLASPDFATREQAAAKLREWGPSALPILIQGSKSPDGEIAARCANLLAMREMVVPAWLPRPYAEVLALSYQEPHPLASIFGKVSLWDERADALFDVISQIDLSPEGQTDVREWLDRRTTLRARAAIADGNLPAARKLLTDYLPHLLNSGMGSSPYRDYASLTALMAGPSYNAKAAFADLAPLHLHEDITQRLEYELFRGDFGDTFDLQGATCRARDYLRMLENPSTAPETILARQLAGKPAEAREREEALANTPPADPAGAAKLTCQLILLDRADLAEALLRRRHDNDLLACLLAHRGQLADALPLHFPNDLQLPEQLLNDGNPTAAATLLRQTSAMWAKDEDIDAHLRFRLVALLTRAREADAAALQEQMALKSLLLQFDLFGTSAIPSEADRFWINSFAADNTAWLLRWQRLQHIRAGNVSAQEAAAIAQDLQTRDIDSVRIAADTLRRLGHADAAATLATAGARHENDPSSLSVLGDIALEKGDPAAAFAWYQKAARFRRTEPSLLYLAGIALSRVPGKHDDAQRLLDTVPFLILGSHEDAAGIADLKKHFEGEAPAMEWFDHYAARFTREFPEDMAARFARQRDRAFAQNNRPEALALQNDIRFALLQSGQCTLTQALDTITTLHRLQSPPVVSQLKCHPLVSIEVSPPGGSGKTPGWIHL